MKIESFRHDDWTKIWAGTWSFLSCTHFGVEYTKLIRFGKRPFISQAIIFVSGGKSNCWATQTDRDILGKYLSEEIKKSPHRALEICNSLISRVDDFTKFMKFLKGKEISLKLLKKFWEEIVIYYHPHINVKYIVDYLEPKVLEKLLPHFEKARIYAEPIFKMTEEVMISLAKDISKKTKIPNKLILCSTFNEIENYLAGSKFPSKDILAERNKNSVMIFNSRGYEVLTGADVKKVESLVLSSEQSNILKGMTAYGGKVKGIVRIILDPTKAGNFHTGDILVAGMTRPDYLPIMKKAAAFVTDAGGILSHAAIVARELKKPCIIGTQRASKILKNSDILEEDA